MLQAQQQQMLAQHQQLAQAGLLPPPQPGMLPPQPTLLPQIQPTYGYNQFQSPITQAPQGHRRVQSSLPASQNHYSASQPNQNPFSNLDTSRNSNQSSNSQPSQGHNRRHSLALSEAKKAAAIEQAKRTGSPPSSSSSTNTTSTTVSPSSSTSDAQIPSFKFPNIPEKEAAPATPVGRSHGRSQSLQIPNRNNQLPGASPQRGFQFPAVSQSSQGGEAGSHENHRPHHSHQRSGSRNFDSNWRQPQTHQQTPSATLHPPSQLGDFANPANQFVPGHRSGRSFNNSISSIQAFSMYPPNQFSSGHGPQSPGQQGNQRKSLFAPYLPQASLPDLLAEGRLVAGVLRVNKKNRSDAYVSTDGLLDADIFICGSKDRNRALEGDLVAVELLEVDEVWGSKKEKEEKKKRKDATEESRASNSIDSDNSSQNASGTGLRRRGSLKQRPTQKKNDDVEVEGQTLLLVEEEALTDEIKPLYAGHVVAVIDRFPGQMFSGTLGLLRPSVQAAKDKQDSGRGGRNNKDDNASQHKPKIVWFKPTDKRVPLIAIPTEQAPNDFVENSTKYADTTFVASIKRWPITSLHPFGTLVENLGSSNDVDIEIEAILRDNNFSADVFPKAVISDLPNPDEDQTFSEAELESRRDFSNEYAIAFSPLEDNSMVEQAVHVKKISDSKVELGIHITDVSHYCPENSPLDREARKRGTSVFLKQRSVSMFPKAFQEYVSFKAEKRSASISVVFEMDPKTFEISDTWIGESLVTPRQVISYADVSSVLEGNAGSETTQAEIDYIKTLRLVSNMFRKQRLGLDEADLPILGLLNYIDDEAVNVRSNIFDGCPVYQMLDEINIKVNCAIAQKSFAVWGNKALLRRQSFPILQKIELFIESVKNLNIDMDTTSSATIQKSILAVKDDAVRKGLEALLYKCMPRARYFVGEGNEPENRSHYFLNVPLYTHFTAPLRRYADVIVHRQARAFIRKDTYDADSTELTNIADSCTFKKDCAKNAQEQSIHLHVCQEIEKKAAVTGQLVIDSIIIQVYESAFDVLIPEYGIEKRVHGDQLPLRKAEFDKKTRYLELYWEDGIDSATYVPDDEKNNRNGPRAGRVRASSAASALAQEQMMMKDNQLDLSKLNLNKKEDEAAEKTDKILAPFFENVITRVDKGERVQEIQVLKHVPVLLRAELGKSIPCLTVRALNPFTK